MKKINNICILTSSYPSKNDPYFSGTFIFHFVSVIKKLGYKVYVVMPYKSDNILYQQGVQVCQFNWYKSKFKRLVNFNLLNPLDQINAVKIAYFGSKYLINFCKKYKIDFCIACWAIPAGFWAMMNNKKWNIPYMVWSLGSDIHTWAKYPIIKSIIKKVLKKADYLYADGIELSQQVEKLSNKKCNYFPTTTLLERQKVKKIKLKINKNKYNFLFVGRWGKVKGIDVLFNAIKLFFEKGYKADFYLLGNGPMFFNITNKMKKYWWNKNIHYPGQVSRIIVDAYMQKCNCLVIPSRKESIPSVFSEALKNRMVLLVKNTGDMGYLVKKYEVGIVIMNNKPVELMKGMIKIIKFNQKPNKLINNQKRLLTIFNMNKAAKQLSKKIQKN